MGKKKKRLKQLTAGIVIGAITISTIIGTMFAANSIKPEEATTSVAVFEDLLNNRSFVIDTFTKDTMPDSNPYGKLDGVGNIDYLSKDFLDNYKNDSKFGSAVDLYYRMNHEGETFSEIPSALLDVFANEADWTKFCQGAKSKSYDSLLTSIYQNDYKSVSGKSVGNEENSMQTLRTYSEKLGVVKDADEFIKEYFGDLYSDVNEIDEYNYLRQKTKLFDDNLETYVTNVNKVLIDGALKSDNTKTAKDFSSLYEAKYYADYGREGAPSIWNERYVAMNVEKNTKYLKKVTSAVKNIVGTGISTVNNIIMMENLYRNQESMHDTLVRVRNNAKKNNDNTFIRASSTYLKMLESDDLGDNVILNSGLKAIYDYSTTELNKFIWDKTKEGIRDEAASIVATQTGMDTLASQMAVSSTVARTNAILAVGEALTKYGTGFDDVCEKIYLMKYLQKIKEYAVEAFNTDKDNYQKYKNESNMKEMDNYASAAIDDLQFLKRIVLLQNQLGYKTADAQVGSIAGKIISWIKGCESANDLEARYTNLQNALVDTAINPISINPFSIDEGCTLKVIHSTDSELQTYAVYTNKEGKKCSIAEFDKVLLAGIKINGGTLNISDQADRDIVMNSLFVTNNGGSLQITGNGGDIHVGRFDINGSFNKPEKCTKKLIVEGNCNVISSCSLENLDLDIEGDCNVDDYAVLAFGGSNVTVDGDMNCNSGHLHMVNESDTLRVNGSLMLGEGYGTNSEHEMTAGTVEVKGDFTSKYKRDNSPYGYYETANHKTVFSGDKTQKISFVESSEVNQFNGNLELKNPEINFATPIYSLTVNNDMNITKTDNLEIKTILKLEKGSLVTNGNVHVKTMNIESGKNNIKGNLQAEGNVSFGEGSLTIEGNTEITQGNLHMKNDSDKLLVKGNLILGEDYGTNSEHEMTAGTVEVKGDFTSKYKRDNSSYGYYETEEHKTIFSGDKTQKISFVQACNVNGFNENLELVNNDINFATSIYDVKINQDTELTNTKELVVIGTLDSGDYKFTTTGNVEAERFNTRGKEVDIEGNVKAGILYITGNNNQTHGNLKTTDRVIFDEGNLSVDGDMEMEKGHLYMTKDSDKLLVKGNLILGEGYGTNSEHEMTAGTVEVKGDFTSKYKRDNSPYGYYETANHKTVFSGDKTQKISFVESSEVNQFNGNLELKNPEINFATPIYSLTVNNDMNITKTDNLEIKTILNLEKGSLVTNGNVHAKTMNIESRKNNIKGNLQVEGNVSFGEGSLTIDGNTEITQGNLHMKNDSDNLLVKGNLILGEDYGTNSEYEMTEGTVEVKGDFTSKYKRDYRSYGYYETLNHKTIFSGDKTQKISFTQACNVNGFNENLELENNDINFATPIYDVKINQDTELTNTKELVVTGTLDSGDYKFTTTGNVEAERFNTRGKEVDIEGNVKAGILYIAGDNNQIHGNLKTTDSVIFSEGSLSIAGDTEIEKGHLYMTNDSDKLLVKGNLILGEDYGTNSEHEMTAGTVEVKGDFTSKYKRDYRPYGYYETGNHATIFSGGKTQKISFAEPSEVNQFNGNLELKNSDINFATPIYSLSLNQDTTLIHTDTLNVTDTLKLNGNKLLTTGKVNYGRLSGNGGTLEENPKLGHNYYKQLQPADPKEYDTKYADEIWVCKSCGKIFTDAEGTKEYDPDPCKNGHTIVVDEGKKATCITEGLTEGEHCKVCKKIIVAQKKIPATGHKYSEWITTKENTCTEEGITQRKCGICGFTESKKLDKKAHEWDTDFTVDKKATFQADGSKSKHCKNCDAVYGSTVIPRVNEMKLSAVTYSYTGGVKTPSVTVKDVKGKTLKNNVDYTIKYASGRKNVGTYSVIMTLKGNYSTSKTMKFIINPKGTSISKLSKAKKSFTVKWKKQNTQTTGYRLIYSMNSKFKTGNKYVMITSNKTTSKSIKKLKAKKKYYIRICTYKTVGGTKYYSGWSSVKSVTTK